MILTFSTLKDPNVLIIVFGDGFGSFYECIRRRGVFSLAATEALSPWPRTSVDMNKTLGFDKF